MEGKVVIDGGRPYEEDFKAALAEYVSGYARLSPEQQDELTADMVREFFFIKGRESGKVAINLDGDGIVASAGVQVFIEADEFRYEHTDSNAHTTQEFCDDDDCRCTELGTEQRLKKAGLGDLKEVENPIEF